MSRHTISIDPDYLYKPVKVRTNNVLFWGCCHLNHLCENWDAPLWALRGYNSAKEHFDGLINNWNNKANENTVGFLLGDTVFSKDGDKTFEYFFQSIKFQTIYLLCGNHYSGVSQILSRLNSNVWNIDKTKQVIFVPNYFEAFVCGQPICFSHYPIVSWNGAANGSWMLYAHVHGNLGKSEVGKLYQSRGKSKEVSVEVAPSPYFFDELHEHFAKVEAFAPDHHNSSTQNPF